MVESLAYSLIYIIQSYNEMPYGARYFIIAILGLLILYACFLFFKIVLRQIKKFLTGERAAKILGTKLGAVLTEQSISTEYTTPATTMTESVVPQHIPQYWNDTTVHPWRRYFARSLDMILCSYIITGVIFSITFTITKVAMGFFGFDHDSLIKQFSLLVGLYPIQVIIINTVIKIIVITIMNAVQIGLVGSSAGKWFFGVRVLNNEYKPIGFKLAFRRELMVLYRGIAFSIPVILCIAEFIAYKELRENGITTWDRDLDCIVLHKYMSFWQAILCTVGFIIVLGVFMLSVSIMVGFGFRIAPL